MNLPPSTLPSISLIAALLCQPLHATPTEFITAIRTSQSHLAKAQPQPAAAILTQWEKENPTATSNPTFCYQLFFVALEGLGDRTTARRMLHALELIVENGELSTDSTQYRTVTEAWQRAIFATDSDLPRLAHRKMSKRFKASTSKP